MIDFLVALRANELGNISPYCLSFAGKGQSGASFGVLQHDMHTNPAARSTFLQICPNFDTIAQKLSQKLVHNPLTPDETTLVNGKLSTPSGQALIDKLDQQQLYTITDEVAMCSAVAKSIDDISKLYMACWVNMTGAPTDLRVWCVNRKITVTAIEQYLRNTKFYSNNLKSFKHLQESVREGIR